MNTEEEAYWGEMAQAHAQAIDDLMRPTLTNRLFDALFRRAKRRDWVANPADPTAVTQYTFKGRRWSLTMTSSWVVDTTFTLRGRSWRSIDARPALWLFSRLEDAHARQSMRCDV